MLPKQTQAAHLKFGLFKTERVILDTQAVASHLAQPCSKDLRRAQSSSGMVTADLAIMRLAECCRTTLWPPRFEAKASIELRNLRRRRNYRTREACLGTKQVIGEDERALISDFDQQSGWALPFGRLS